MNFIQWLKMDYARSKQGWFELLESYGKTPTNRLFAIYYMLLAPVLIWFAPVCYLIERYAKKKIESYYKE
jgi:hypothetical protein